MIHFNVPPMTGDELRYISEAIGNHKICGDGVFTRKCSEWMENRFRTKKVLLTTSGSTALDMALLLCDLAPDDEVILPSFTFSSTANSAVLCGAKLVFVDIRPDTMNIDDSLIEKAITDKTKVIIVMHYAGVSCDMKRIMRIAANYHLLVVEDAAQGVMSEYNGKALGTIGDFGCYSFHETKNYSMGEGGALIINNPEYIERAEILREKGTNRSKFFRGQVDKYTWVDFGGSYLPSELNAAYLWAQLQIADEINENRLSTWNYYRREFSELEKSRRIEFQFIPDCAKHNAHMFYVKLHDLEDRTAFIRHMRDRDILTPFHYIPLHSAPAGIKYGRFYGEDIYTTRESSRLARMPLYYNISMGDLERVVRVAKEYLENE